MGFLLPIKNQFNVNQVGITQPSAADTPADKTFKPTGYPKPQPFDPYRRRPRVR